MNSKQLFMLIDKIDEQFINEAWGDDNEAYSDIDIDIDYDSDVRRGVNVVIEHKPFRVFTPVIVTAACMLLFVAGGFTAVNIFRGDLLSPGGRVDPPASYIESDVSSTSSESDTSSESSESSEFSESEDSSINEPLISDVEKYGDYPLDYIIPPGGETYSEATEKLNQWEYAEIRVDYTDATEEHPIIAQILKSYPKGGMEPISEEIKITGPGAYEIEYTTLRGAGSYSYLYLVYPIWNDNKDGMYLDTKIIGRWSP